MARGLIELGQSFNASAMKAGNTAVALEAARNREDEMAEGAEKQQRVGMALSGAAAGAQLGSAAGPPGMAIGGAIGALAGALGARLF